MVMTQRKRQVKSPNLDDYYVEQQIKFTKLPKIQKRKTQDEPYKRHFISMVGSRVAQNRKATKTSKKRPILKDKQNVRQRKSKDSYSVTAVDRSLEKSKLAGKAKKGEMSAFTAVPNVEISKLLRTDTEEGNKESGLEATRVSLGNKVSEGNRENVKRTDEEEVEDAEEDCDDECGVCGDGGNMVLCDSCPSTFHQKCLRILNLPSGKWHCVYCLCKFCGAFEAGKRHGAKSEMLTCSLCEGNFHDPCVNGKNVVNLDSHSLSFCGSKCSEIYEKLHEKFGVKIRLKNGFSCTFIKHFDHLSQERSTLKRRCNMKVANAFFVLNKCFSPTFEKRTGTNMIEDIAYNRKSNIRRLDFSGFFTAVLEKDGNMISVATLRIHGNKLAEMPYFGTLEMYRGLGMCGRLLGSIESVLKDLGVRKLVLPSLPEAIPTWKKNGFKPLANSTKKLMKSINMIIFVGAHIFEKDINPE